MTAPKQITIRNPSPELAKRLKAIAEAKGMSLNSTILSLLREAVGIQERRSRLVRYATWTDEDAEDFEIALQEQRTINDELWT